MIPMKSLATLAFILLSLHNSWGYDYTAYQKAMQQSIQALNEAQDIASLQQSMHRFERIAKAEKSQWLPWYYAAYASITMGAMAEEADRKDQYLDHAQQFLDEATLLETENSELTALQGYLYMIRVTVDPANRGPHMAPKATQVLSQATQMNPENPRALLLLGQMQYGTARFFNSDTAQACQLVSQAIEKFDKAPHHDALAPAWGKEMALALQKQCQP